MAFSLHNHCPCRVLCRVHTRLTTAPRARVDASCTSIATCKSLCAWKFLSCLTPCWSASSFDKQVDSVKEHLTRTQTDSLFVCGLVTSKILLWFGLYKSCHRSTATLLAKTQLPIAGSPEKALNFFSFESATASCVSSGDLVATFSDVCGSRLVSAGTPRFVLDPTIVTPALSSSSAVRILHVEREVQRRKNKLGTGALRTFAWINCAEPGLIFFRVCSRGEREREREREWTELTAGVNFVFSGFLDDPRRDKRASKCRWEELGAAKRTVAYRPVSSVRTGISLPSIFSQSAERPHEQRRMASKKEQLFALFFVAWITHFSHGKFFMGFRRAKSTQGNTNCQKNIFEDDQVLGHHPRALTRRSKNKWRQA